ncbi:MAG: hypothetical protein M1832_005742 [Thelocarpon impressellum]|nr:MAG: hypothetical protein M1832_005742 [Thelocarpon impressellum]
MATENVSSDLIWEITRPNNSFLVKRLTNGGAQFSRDPLNLMNKHSRKHAGFVNNKAVGIQPGEKGGVTLHTKKAKNASQPAISVHKVTWGSGRTSRKTYKGIVNHTAKQGYRPDLRAEAVSRASAIRKSQQPKKDVPERKARGTKARKAAEKS